MEISEKNLNFHYNTPVVDLHADTLMWAKLLNYDIFKEHKQRVPLSPILNHVDIPRMIKGGLNLQAFGIVTNYWSNKNERRNLKVDQILAVAQTGGVIGIMFSPIFLNGTLRGSVKDIVDHMEYVKVLGENFLRMYKETC